MSLLIEDSKSRLHPKTRFYTLLDFDLFHFSVLVLYFCFLQTSWNARCQLQLTWPCRGCKDEIIYSRIFNTFFIHSSDVTVTEACISLYIYIYRCISDNDDAVRSVRRWLTFRGILGLWPLPTLCVRALTTAFRCQTKSCIYFAPKTPQRCKWGGLRQPPSVRTLTNVIYFLQQQMEKSSDALTRDHIHIVYNGQVKRLLGLLMK